MQATKLDNLHAFPYVRAALVGYGAKNQNGGITRAGSGACSQLYRQCPAEPTQLLNYINNHNGGLVNQVGSLLRRKLRDHPGFESGCWQPMKSTLEVHEL